MDPHETRRELEQVEASLDRTVEEIVAILSTDVPSFVQRTVRRVFTASDRADSIEDAALAELKAETLEISSSLRDALQSKLGSPKAWAWEGPEPPPSGAMDLSPHPKVAAELAEVGAKVSGLLSKHGLEAEPEHTAYQLPSYFVGGRLMKSLVESYWKALSRQVELSAGLVEAEGTARQQQRQDRWDQA